MLIRLTSFHNFPPGEDSPSCNFSGSLSLPLNERIARSVLGSLSLLASLRPLGRDGRELPALAWVCTSTYSSSDVPTERGLADMLGRPSYGVHSSLADSDLRGAAWGEFS